MKTWLKFLLLISIPTSIYAQFGGGFSDVPVIIDAKNKYAEGGVAIATDDVSIFYENVQIFCDYAEYNSDTRDILLRGRVRIYRNDLIFSGERAVYNMETKTLRASDFSGTTSPFLFAADTISTIGPNAYNIRKGIMTTHDSADPDYHFQAKTMRVYPDDRVIFKHVTLRLGKIPVFWYPYLYQSLREDMAFTMAPGYSSVWGAYLLTNYTFPLSEKASGSLHFDLRADRGVGVGFDSDFRFGKDDRSWGNFRSYYAHDTGTDINTTSLAREQIDVDRYRLSFQSRTYFTDDVYANVDINKLSDSLFMEDFFRAEFITNPQPDNYVSLTKWNENYTITGIARAQINDFQPTTERLPEVVWDIKRQEIKNTGFFYSGETGFARLKNKYTDDSIFPNYEVNRFDTLHQIFYPKIFGGWLTVTPRIGFRGTYYDKTQTSDGDTGGSEFRSLIIGGIESSFKISKAYEQVQSRALGLDGLRHVIQPYLNLSLVSDPGTDPDSIPQFDTRLPSTQLASLNFPQFNSIDAIDQWSVLRLGVRNRLQTRRNDFTFNWLELDTYFDINFDNPYDDTDFSNFFNRLRFRPVPWTYLTIDAQLPLFDDGFTEVNSQLSYMATDDIELNIGHRFLEDSPFFQDSSFITFGGYWRINENWGVSMRQEYEMDDSTLETQRYAIHRDLTSWVASLGAIIRDNRGGEEEFGLLLTFTLKDFPQLNLPLNLDPQAGGGE